MEVPSGPAVRPRWSASPSGRRPWTRSSGQECVRISKPSLMLGLGAASLILSWRAPSGRSNLRVDRRGWLRRVAPRHDTREGGLQYREAVRFPRTANFEHRADARRTAPLAAAVGDQVDRGIDEFIVQAEQPLGQAHAARRAFVQVDRGAAGVRRADLVDAAQVVRVAHQVEWGDVMELVGEGGEGALEAVTRRERGNRGTRERVADNYGWE